MEHGEMSISHSMWCPQPPLLNSYSGFSESLRYFNRHDRYSWRSAISLGLLLILTMILVLLVASPSQPYCTATFWTQVIANGILILVMNSESDL